VFIKNTDKPKSAGCLTSKAVWWRWPFPYLQFNVASLLREGEKRYTAEGLASPWGWLCSPRGAGVLYE